MPDADAALLLAAAEAAGRVAMRHFRTPLAVRRKADDSPVTAADLEVNAFLEAELRAARPAYGWLSEESPEDPGRLTAERIFIVDPIDGTRAFIDDQTAWGVAIAVAEGGRVLASVMHMPAQGKTYAARAGGGATLNGRPIRAGARPGPDGASLLATRAALEPARWTVLPRDVALHYRPSLVYRMCLVAEGRFDAMVTFRESADWDVAPGALICAEAGARATTRAGAAFAFNAPRPRQPGVLAANPALHAALAGRTAPFPA